jgi:hypothetical protein
MPAGTAIFSTRVGRSFTVVRAEQLAVVVGDRRFIARASFVIAFHADVPFVLIK